MIFLFFIFFKINKQKKAIYNIPPHNGSNLWYDKMARRVEKGEDGKCSTTYLSY